MRRLGRTTMPTAHASCAHATTAKNVPKYHASWKCSPITEKWMAADATDAAASAHTMTSPMVRGECTDLCCCTCACSLMCRPPTNCYRSPCFYDSMCVSWSLEMLGND